MPSDAKIPRFELPRFYYRRRFELGLIFSLSLMLLLFEELNMAAGRRRPNLHSQKKMLAPEEKFRHITPHGVLFYHSINGDSSVASQLAKSLGAAELLPGY